MYGTNPVVNLRAILVYDPDPSHAELLRKQAGGGRFPVIPVATAAEATQALMSTTQRITAIFFNPAAPTEEWIGFLKHVRQARPGLPVFMILEPGASSKLAGLDLRKFGIREAAEKPLDHAKILELVKPAALSFDAETALSKSREVTATELAIGQPSTDDRDYTSLRADDFLSGSTSYFDVFVRVSSGRYLKILRSGDVFDADRVEGYLKKGLTHFHIRHEVQEQYLTYTGHLASALITHKVAPPEVKAAQVMNQGDQVMGFLQKNGLKERDLGFARSFASNVAELTRQLKLDKSGLFRGFMDSVVAYDHGVGTALIAGLLGRELEITYNRSVELVGLGALLHDFGLIGLPENLAHEDESRMLPSELLEYQTHAERGATALAGIKGIDSAILQAVRQHHMRNDGTGFPGRSPGQRISLIGEIVGVSSEFHRLIARTETDREFQVLLRMEEKILPQFSNAVAAGFRRAFYDPSMPEP